MLHVSKAISKKRKGSEQSASGDQVHQRAPSILFTAFEPSGDALAAPLIAELKRLRPDIQIFAWGGPLMEKAGAKVISQTTEASAMGLNGFKRIREVRKEINRIKQWIRQYRVVAYVPVDSPAANFPICKAVRKTGARIVHLNAPQIWAWAGWRIRKLRRLTDLVLCLLPFEDEYFNDRDVPARFIGHPAINREIDSRALRENNPGLPQGAPRVALFPGSREHEVKANINLLADTFNQLQSRHSGTAGVIAAATPALAKIVRDRLKVFPTGLHMVTGMADEVVAWCDLALVVSGTMTLHITRQRRPMVGVYKTGFISWLGAKIILRTPYRLLPNIIAGREIAPEFVPHIGGCGPVVKAASYFFHDSRNAANQAEELKRVCLRFANKRPAEEAAHHILEVMRKGATGAGGS